MKRSGTLVGLRLMLPLYPKVSGNENPLVINGRFVIP